MYFRTKSLMNVWPSASRLASSSRCLQPVRLAVGICSSAIPQPPSDISSRRHNSSLGFGSAYYKEPTHASPSGQQTNATCGSSSKEGGASEVNQPDKSRSRITSRRRRSRERVQQRETSSILLDGKPSRETLEKGKSTFNKVGFPQGNGKSKGDFDCAYTYTLHLTKDTLADNCQLQALSHS